MSIMFACARCRGKGYRQCRDHIPDAFYRNEPYVFIGYDPAPRRPSILDSGLPFDQLDLYEFFWVAPIEAAGYLRSVDIVVTEPSGKVTPKQRRRALHKRNHRVKVAGR